MHYPTLKTISATREAVAAFGGLNRGADIAPGEFSQMENFTADSYPLAATCLAPKPYLTPIPQGVLAKGELCHVTNNLLYVGEKAYDVGLTDGEKKLISMGAYILILPDKIHFNTADPTDFGHIEQVVTEPQWRLDPCDSQGKYRIPDYVSKTKPENPDEGDLWYDFSGKLPRLKVYNATTQTWGPAQGYVRLELQNGGNPKWPYDSYFTDCFVTGDRVQLQIMGDSLVDDMGQPLRTPSQQEEVLERAIWGLAGEAELLVLSGLCVVIPGMLPEAIYLGNTLRFSNPMPQMDFLFECGNRMWGCRYGMQNGKFVNEIYASRLGDFRSWTAFQGVSTDAYTASVGTDGPFTGAMNYLGYPLFFKENYVHRVYGSYPAEYRIQTTPCQGVAPGCAGSLCMLGDTALYLGRNGVCAYDGAMPSLISQKLGQLSGPGVAGVLGHKYYLSTPDGFYVYDSRRRLWHRRETIGATTFTAWDGKLYYIDPGQKALMQVDGGQPCVGLRMTTGILAGTQQQRIRSICLRYSLQGQARVMVEYDSDGQWHLAGVLTRKNPGWAHLPLKPRRCDHFRLRIEGQGSFTLHSIIKTVEKGSDLP